MAEITREALQELVKPVTDFIGTKEINKSLEEELSNEFPHDGAAFKQIESFCHEAIKAGWMCKHEGGGIR